MRASELRIGNYIENTDSQMASYMVVNADVIKQNEHTMYASLEPIPLTEEWLLKLGAKRDKIDNTYYLSELEIMLPNFFRYKTSIISRIDYVHQLQNLYFALRGEELTRKP